MAVNMSGLPGVVRSALGDNQRIGYVTDGVSYALANDIVNYATGSGSKLVNGQWYAYVDDVVFFGAVAGITLETGVSEIIVNQLGVLPFSSDINLSIAEGVIVSAAKVMGDTIDAQPSIGPLHYLRHPTALLHA
jgi:hypothetical protein